MNLYEMEDEALEYILQEYKTAIAREQQQIKAAQNHIEFLQSKMSEVYSVVSIRKEYLEFDGKDEAEYHAE